MAQANPAQAVANIYRTPELWEKIVFTFLCLVVYRLGSYIAVPGVNAVVAPEPDTTATAGALLTHDVDGVVVQFCVVGTDCSVAWSPTSSVVVPG